MSRDTVKEPIDSCIRFSGYVNETPSVPRATGKDVFSLIYECKRTDKSTLLPTSETKMLRPSNAFHSHTRR